MNDNDNIFNELYNYRIGYKKNKDKLKEKYIINIHLSCI